MWHMKIQSGVSPETAAWTHVPPACATCRMLVTAQDRWHIGSDGVERHLSDNRSKRSNRKAAGEPGKVLSCSISGG